MASKVAPLGAKGWKPLVLFDKEARAWTWIGPLPPVTSSSSQVRFLHSSFLRGLYACHMGFWKVCRCGQADAFAM